MKLRTNEANALTEYLSDLSLTLTMAWLGGYGFNTINLYKSGIINSYEILDSFQGYNLVTYLVPVTANEYGIWRESGGQNLVNISEEELFEKLFNLTSQGTDQKQYPDSKVYQLNEAQILEYAGILLVLELRDHAVVGHDN